MGMFEHYQAKDVGVILLVGVIGVVGGYKLHDSQESQGAGLPPATTYAGGVATGSALEPFPGGLMCSPEKSTVVVDQQSMVDGNYSLYRAINVNFGEESDIGIPGGNPIQGTPTEAFVLKVADESGIAVTDVNNVPPGNYQVRSICNGPGTSWNANSTTV